jgi:hypothetical protein
MDHDERDKAVSKSPRPIPIREAVGEPTPVPGRAKDGASASGAPGMRGQRERPRGPRGRGRNAPRQDNRRSRNNRRGSAAGSEEPRRARLAPTPLEDLPHRTFEHDGSEWIVRLCGQTSTGSTVDPGAGLMHLSFYSATDPSVVCGDLLVPGKSLEELSEIQLPELLAFARSTPPLTKRANAASQG